MKASVKAHIKLSEEQVKNVNLFNQRIKDGSIEIGWNPCLCGSSTQFRKLFDHDRYGFWNPIVICKECGLIQSNPGLSELAYKEFYSSNQHLIVYGGDEYLLSEEARYANNCAKYAYIFESLRPIIERRNLKTVLELGCGGGWNLFPFANNGYAVTGYDYSPIRVEMGKNRGLNLLVGSIEELKFHRF